MKRKTSIYGLYMLSYTCNTMEIHKKMQRCKSKQIYKNFLISELFFEIQKHEIGITSNH
jgi:hypothetical protein